jgi:hypothetical protein
MSIKRLIDSDVTKEKLDIFCENIQCKKNMSCAETCFVGGYLQKFQDFAQVDKTVDDVDYWSEATSGGFNNLGDQTCSTYYEREQTFAKVIKKYTFYTDCLIDSPAPTTFKLNFTPGGGFGGSSNRTLLKFQFKVSDDAAGTTRYYKDSSGTPPTGGITLNASGISGTAGGIMDIHAEVWTIEDNPE